jgi:hypothetical protein
MDKIKDFLLNILETYGSQLSCWAWNKRWNKGNRKDTSSSEWIKGHKKWKSDITESEKLQNELEPLPDMKLFNTKRGNPFKEGTD